MKQDKNKYDYINPYWILRAAKEDKLSADLLYEKSIQWMCSDDEDENFASVSFGTNAIVLYSLSIEHGLKALLGLEGKKEITSHNFRDLYTKLSTETKEKIKNELSEERFQVNIESYIDENRNDFIDWRYSYEKTVSASTDFLKDFAEAIIKVGDSFA